ncbi:hypothetical protein A3Q56_02152 [Intoshia linei]|uniref:Uncharacterized protein n=1 Tax=Intoshia linei TaxID=1819745 RepID=A0A177B8V5_9BILA|nr:hypothetical protein A3Q56_02152 [Intoshia linei]
MVTTDFTRRSMTKRCENSIVGHLMCFKLNYNKSPTNFLRDYNVFPLKQRSGNNIVGHFNGFTFKSKLHTNRQIIKWVLSLKHEKSILQFRSYKKSIRNIQKDWCEYNNTNRLTRRSKNCSSC